MKDFLYDFPILPNGFKFPVDYLGMVLADDFVDIEPWRFYRKIWRHLLFIIDQCF